MFILCTFFERPRRIKIISMKGNQMLNILQRIYELTKKQTYFHVHS